MTMNSSGPISLAGATVGQSIAVELGLGTTSQISLNCASVRTLGGQPTAGSPIQMPTCFYGKSNRVTVNLTIAANTQNYCIFANRGGTYSAGKTCVNVTVNGGVVVGSSSTGTYAMNTGSGWTSGDVIRITNNGYIVGAGGNGGTGGIAPGGAGGAGGAAMQFQYATSVTNNGIIGGGGGGGGGGSGTTAGLLPGGGGGGGAGNAIGALGTPTAAGGGTAATLTNGGRGNNGACTYSGPGTAGGNGGAAGGNGGTGAVGCCFCSGAGGGGGGGLGGSGGAGGADLCGPGGTGGSAGAATNGAGTYVTWVANGTRYGAIG